MPTLLTFGHAMHRPACPPHPNVGAGLAKRRPLRSHPLACRLLAFPAVAATVDAARDHAPWPARPTRILIPLYQEFKDVPVISISNAQRQPLPWINWQRHRVSWAAGGPLPPFVKQPGKYLAFLGRISPEKRRRSEHRDRRSGSGSKSRSRPRLTPRTGTISRRPWHLCWTSRWSTM